MKHGKVCEKCTEAVIEYADEIFELDCELLMIADLLCAAGEPQIVEASTVSALGMWLKTHLDKRRVIGHRYFGEVVPLDAERRQDRGY